MWLGDLKRAVEDVILRPEENPMHVLEKRGTIAALDLCQLDPAPSVQNGAPTAATMNACSCSSETVPSELPRQPPQLCTSTSLDTIVNRSQPFLQRHSAGVSRRQSRVFSNLHSKRKRSNSLTNYNKRPGSVPLPPSARQTPLRFGEDMYRSSLGSSESHSSVARSEDFSQDYVAEEDEISSSQLLLNTSLSVSPAPVPSCPAPSPNPYMAWRSRPEEEDMDCD